MKSLGLNNSAFSLMLEPQYRYECLKKYSSDLCGLMGTKKQYDEYREKLIKVNQIAIKSCGQVGEAPSDEESKRDGLEEFTGTFREEALLRYKERTVEEFAAYKRNLEIFRKVAATLTLLPKDFDPSSLVSYFERISPIDTNERFHSDDPSSWLEAEPVITYSNAIKLSAPWTFRKQVKFLADPDSLAEDAKASRRSQVHASVYEVFHSIELFVFVNTEISNLLASKYPPLLEHSKAEQLCKKFDDSIEGIGIDKNPDWLEVKAGSASSGGREYWIKNPFPLGCADHVSGGNNENYSDDEQSNSPNLNYKRDLLKNKWTRQMLLVNHLFLNTELKVTRLSKEEFSVEATIDFPKFFKEHPLIELSTLKGK